MNDIRTTKISLNLTAEQLVDVLFDKDDGSRPDGDDLDGGVFIPKFDYVRLHITSIADTEPSDDGKYIFLFYVEVLIRSLIRIFGDEETRAVNIDAISEADFLKHIVSPFQERLGVSPRLNLFDSEPTDTIADLCQFREIASGGYSFEEYGVLLNMEAGRRVLKFERMN